MVSLVGYKLQNTVRIIKKHFFQDNCDVSKLIYFHLWHYLPRVKKNCARHIDTKFVHCPSHVTPRASIESNLLSLSPRLINSDSVRVWLSGSPLNRHHKSQRSLFRISFKPATYRTSFFQLLRLLSFLY